MLENGKWAVKAEEWAPKEETKVENERARNFISRRRTEYFRRELRGTERNPRKIRFRNLSTIQKTENGDGGKMGAQKFRVKIP